MCKIFSVTNVENTQNAWKLIVASHPETTAKDWDGYGVAFLDKQGLVAGRRWTSRWDAFVEYKPAPKALNGIIHPKMVPWGEFDFIGDKNANRSNVHAIISHSRTATSGKGIKNVHPHHYDGFALIHNGIVEDERLELLGTECDSAGILWSYLKHGVPSSPKKIKDAMNIIYGWFACMVIGKDHREQPYVDIWRSAADLYTGYVPGVGIVWATTESILCESVRAAGFSLQSLSKVIEDKMLRLYQNQSIHQKAKVYSYDHQYASWSNEEIYAYRRATGAGNFMGRTMGKASDYQDTTYPVIVRTQPEVIKVDKEDKELLETEDAIEKSYAAKGMDNKFYMWTGSIALGWRRTEITEASFNSFQENRRLSTEVHETMIDRAAEVKAKQVSEQVKNTVSEFGADHIILDHAGCPHCYKHEPLALYGEMLFCTECWMEITEVEVTKDEDAEMQEITAANIQDAMADWPNMMD